MGRALMSKNTAGPSAARGESEASSSGSFSDMGLGRDLLLEVLTLSSSSGAAERARLGFRLMELIRQGADPNVSGVVGERPAHWAARKEMIPFLEILLSAGADLEAKDRKGASPMHWAARAGAREAVDFLLAAGASANPDLDEGGLSPLGIAAKAGNYPMCESLLKAGASAMAGPGGVTPLHRAAASGPLRLVRLFLEAGHDPEALDERGLSAAEWAELGGGDDGCRELLKQAMEAAAARREGLLIEGAVGAGSPRRPPGRI